MVMRLPPDDFDPEAAERLALSAMSAGPPIASAKKAVSEAGGSTSVPRKNIRFPMVQGRPLLLPRTLRPEHFSRVETYLCAGPHTELLRLSRGTVRFNPRPGRSRCGGRLHACACGTRCNTFKFRVGLFVRRSAHRIHDAAIKRERAEHETEDGRQDALQRATNLRTE